MMSIENALPPSRRGQKGIRPDMMTGLRKRLEENPYDPEKNPKGIIDLGSAVNELMLDDLSGWTKRNVKKGHLKSNQQDQPSLPKVAAEFMNEHFRVRLPLTSDNILAANGVTTLLDNLIYNITNEGDTILIPTPTYGLFAQDVCTRNGVRVVEVPCDDIHEERFWGPPPQDESPVQAPEVVRRLEVAIKHELGRKGRVGGIVLVNPDNPLGRCYAAHVLLQVSQLCARHKIHLIVDEIYAISAGDRFSSILSLGLDVNFRNVHVLWGLSKDFGLSGLRVGFLATYNKQVYEAMRALTMVGQVSSFSATVAATLLSDTKYLRNHYLPSFRRRLDKRRKMVEETLDNYEIPHVKPEAGFFVFVDLSKWVELYYVQKHDKGGDLAFLEYLMKQRVFLDPGQALFSQRTGWFRLNFGGEKESFKLGLQRLLHCLRSLDGQEHHEPFTQAPELYFPPPKAMAHFLAV
ncbi:1-aminocyclopropane-1-carboxylate synthase-like protein 1 [Colletotrichum tanaceti]|uniref:1-aminocyclopropane-1-carboxylate synthase-like protein 1 n=1 Tax=Colletotrichum tanaceti TaxID=1306861 RepID=A0A4U6XK02_9PEZI|nr:1-aminocyclopropane-1-carboxylate synthase-like protein 1 [Colletotrichum tanaceti]TKW56114.1 1-aminocyclopropane-1-carboxylate synthase-like protein 1 [Colletotrichum tanaceti]